MLDDKSIEEDGNIADWVLETQSYRDPNERDGQVSYCVKKYDKEKTENVSKDVLVWSILFGVTRQD